MKLNLFHLGIALFFLGFAGFALPTEIGQPLALGIFTAASATFLVHVFRSGEVPLRGFEPPPTYRTKPVAFLLGLLLYLAMFLAFLLAFLDRLRAIALH